jgi:aspartyl-tRNA(Asn)/glutamyl-tRNA(Gln) amidotransferase subunit C
VVIGFGKNISDLQTVGQICYLCHQIQEINMALTTEEVLNIAHLARLKIEQDELERYKQDLSRILEFVEQMNQASVDDIEPMAHSQDMVQPLRADTVTEGNQREKFQANAPATEDGLYLVPKVIE